MNELDAAGIKEPVLRASYEECKRLNSLHGKTYYLATLLLPAHKRPFVHALYGFARYADEIVDDLSSTLSEAEKAAHLKTWGDSVLASISTGISTDHVGAALIDTVRRFNIPQQHFVDFLHSMTMDLTVGSFKTYEDLERGRIYLPLDELAQFGVSKEMLYAKKLTPEITAALKFQIERVRELQREAEPGIQLLEASSRPCIMAASTLYCGIVDEVEKIGYDVFNKRAKTSTARRLRVALPAFIRALAAR